VAASAARSLGRRQEARRVAFVPWASCAARPSPVAFRPRPASRPLPSWSAFRVRARPPLWFLRASRRRPAIRAPASSKRRPRPCVARGPWFQSSRPCCGLLRRPQLVRAWVLGRVVRGGPRRFFPEAPAPGNARASGRFVRRGRCHVPCFSPLANRARPCHARHALRRDSTASDRVLRPRCIPRRVQCSRRRSP
jgi:hypothetical protein